MRNVKMGNGVAVLALVLALTACAGTTGTAGTENPDSQTDGVEESSASDKMDKTSETLQPPEDGWVSLTAEEIQWFNEQFFNVDGKSIVNAFVNTTYTDIREIDLAELFYDVNEEISEKEKTALEKAEMDIELDIQKRSTSSMNELFLKYAGISLEECQKIGLDSFVYLKEFDAYYSAHNDSHYQRVEVKSGEKYANGDVSLLCISCDTEEEREVVLKTVENRYCFVYSILASEK